MPFEFLPLRVLVWLCWRQRNSSLCFLNAIAFIAFIQFIASSAWKVCLRALVIEFVSPCHYDPNKANITRLGDARAVIHLQNARTGRAKHESRDRAIVHHMIVSERKYFIVHHQEHSLNRSVTRSKCSRISSASSSAVELTVVFFFAAILPSFGFKVTSQLPQLFFSYFNIHRYFHLKRKRNYRAHRRLRKGKLNCTGDISKMYRLDDASCRKYLLLE